MEHFLDVSGDQVTRPSQINATGIRRGCYHFPASRRLLLTPGGSWKQQVGTNHHSRAVMEMVIQGSSPQCGFVADPVQSW